ncbi:MAG: class I SAM-dependent methyltransferase [Gemmatimonadota bacterium]
MSVSAALKALVKEVPQVKALIAERDALRAASGLVPAGHYYSPIPSLDEVRRDDGLIFREFPRSIPGVDLREDEQLALLQSWTPLYDSMPFRAEKVDGLRYYFENEWYGYCDATMLHCMIRHLRPRRIMEIGSGFSSCVTMDTNERFFGGAIDLTFIDPYPERLLSLLREEDKSRIHLIEKRLQDVPLEQFQSLEAHDILFVDSTHVSKVNSDVNRIFFEILPAIARGVHVHFHDVFYPFEYPRDWIYDGCAWNELYMLRAFLQYNSGFEVVMMNTMMQHFHEPFFREHMPLCLENPGGSIWLRKV